MDNINSYIIVYSIKKENSFNYQKIKIYKKYKNFNINFDNHKETNLTLYSEKFFDIIKYDFKSKKLISSKY